MAAHIDPALILRLQKALHVGRREVYRRIEDLVNTFHIDRRPAALLLASQHGVNTGRFATAEDRAALREALRDASRGSSFNELTREPGASPGSPIAVPSSGRKTRTRGTRRRVRGGDSTEVWLVHGRNLRVADELRKLLRAMGLNPVEWTQAVARTRQGSPYVGTVLDMGIGNARVTVVLMTPDDEARLRAPLRTASDGSHETRLTPQPRLNVIWEGGMAFGRDPRRAVLVQIGQVRSFSNIAGRHVVHLTGSAESRKELATKLKAAGCAVDTEGTDWLSHGDFSLLVPQKRGRRRHPRQRR